MDKLTSIKKRNNLSKIVILAFFGIVVTGGILYQSTNNNKQNEDAELDKIQGKLINSLILPVDYKKVPGFSLTDSSSNAVTADIFNDRWSFIFFGYMNCPDICPLTLSTVKNITDALASENVNQPQIVFVSVDPARDTPEQLKTYLNYFDENYVGITGSVAPLSKWVASMGIQFERHDESDKAGYAVDHSASILLIDPEHRIRGVLNAPLEVETVIHDYRLIVETLSDVLI